MSKIEKILDGYSALDKATEELNDAVITLKKAKLLADDKVRYGKLYLTSGELAGGRKIVTKFLRRMTEMGKPEGHSGDLTDEQIAGAELAKKLKGLLPMGHKLKALIHSIDSDRLPDDQQFQLLDEIVSMLDRARKVVFQQLRTTKG